MPQQINLDDYFGNNSINGTEKPTLKPITNPGTKNVTPQVTKNINSILENQLPEIAKNSYNPYMMGKSHVFGADMNHHQFERYYNHPQYSKLGFNPFIDNEAIYNANSTWWDDVSRASTQWGTLASLGLKDAFSWGNEVDREAAREYEKASAIGTSTRGGVGGFVSNLYLNSGYTMGIMGEIVLEELALAGITFASGGTAGGVAAARTGVNIARLFKGFKRAGELFKTSNKVVNALDNMQDINVFRKVYNGLKSGDLVKDGLVKAGKFIGGAADEAASFIAPDAYGFLKNFNKLDNLSGIAKTTIGVGAAYRTVRNARLAFGESALEAGMVKNEMLSELYSDFVDKNGRAPDETESGKIIAAADEAALKTASQNMPLIYFSNNLVFGKLFRGFNPLRGLENLENKFFKAVLNKKTGIELVEKGFKTTMKALIKPKTYGKMALNYLSANISEGLQESGQEVIAGANKEYYKNLYNNEVRGSYYDTVADHIGKQFSAEGFEVFASGFFMGGLISGASGPIVKAKEKFLKFTDSKFEEKKEAARQNLQNKVNILNEIYKDPTKWDNQNLNNLSEQVELDKKMGEAEKNGDAKGFYDAKYRSMGSHLYTIFEMGMEKTFKQRFQELEKLDDEELLQAIPNAGDAQKARKSIQDLYSKMDDFKKTYNFVKDNLSTPFDPTKYKQGTPEYEQEALGYIMHREAQKDLIFMRETFRTQASRMSSILGEAVKDVGVENINATDLTRLFSIPDVKSEINALKEELEALGPENLVTPQAKALQKDRQSKLKLLEEFDNAMSDLISDVQPIEGETVEESNEIFKTKENTINKSVYDRAQKAYKSYVKYLAGVRPVTDKNLEGAFEKLVDYYLMDTDGKRLNNAFNILMNPDSFYEYSARKKQVIDAEYADRKVRIGQALTAYEKKMQDNELLQSLYARDMFFDVEDYQALINEGKMPKRLYDISGKDMIRSTSLKYAEAIDIVKKYLENVLNIPLTDIQLDYAKDLDPYNTVSRDKLPFDERTYDDLAKQFGFDPSSARTEVPLKEVLTAIVDSEFATEQEKALARRLVKLAKPDETVTFVKNLAGPGRYTAEEQTVIDARYSSSEFKQNAQSHALETSILREEVNRRIYKGVKEDAEFRNTMSDIFNAAVKYYKDNENFYDKPFVGLRSLDDFITETMTSDEFRTFLDEVEYTPTTKSAWREFVDKVIKYIESVFASESSNTALNAAISAITAKIDKSYRQAQEVKGEAVQEERIKPQELSLEELTEQSPELVNDLVNAYKEFVRNTTGQELNVIAETEEQANDIIKNSEGFEQFIKGKSPKVLALFEKYFPESEVREIKRRSGIRQQQTQTDQEFLLTEQIKKLRELGYTEAEIMDMDVLEGINIILQGETKEETAERLANEREQLDSERDEVRKTVEKQINDIQDYNDYEVTESEILARISLLTTTAGFRSDEISEMLENKKKELAYKTEFDDINVDDYVIINNIEKGYTGVYRVINGVYRVINKTKNKLTLVNVKNNELTWTENRKSFKENNSKRYIFKYDINMAPEDVKINVVTPEGQATSNDNVQVFENLTEEELDAAFKASKNVNPATALNNFLDKLNNACE